MAQERGRVDPVTDLAVRVAVLTIIDDELNQSTPELAEDLEHRVDYPEQYGGEVIARIPDGWVIDWRDVARLVLQQIEREDPPLVERLEQPDGDMHRFHGRRGQPPHAGSVSPAPVSANSPAYAAKTQTKTGTTKTTGTTERPAASSVLLAAPAHPVSD